MKPWLTIPIEECGEALVPIPAKDFAFFDPHPYVAAGAPYGGVSPWLLRTGALQALSTAQQRLQAAKPGWRLYLFDVYRPNAVQAYMVEREFGIRAVQAGLDPAALTPAQREELAKTVFYYWSFPSLDPAAPPLHSTGGVVDCTLMDAAGREVDMGAPIDEGADPAAPEYFATAADERGRAAHAHRSLMKECMAAAGFVQHHAEWWHFDLGDQYWAWRQRESGSDPTAVARYGRADLV